MPEVIIQLIIVMLICGFCYWVWTLIRPMLPACRAVRSDRGRAGYHPDRGHCAVLCDHSAAADVAKIAALMDRTTPGVFIVCASTIPAAVGIFWAWAALCWLTGF